MSLFGAKEEAEKREGDDDGEKAEAEKKQGELADVLEFGDPKEVSEKHEKLKESASHRGLNTRLQFLQAFLTAAKEKYPMSAEQTAGQFLQRLLIENPWMIAVNYYNRFLMFDDTTTEGELTAFVDEVDFFVKNTPKLKSAMKKGDFPGSSIKPVKKFVKAMEKLKKAAEQLADLSDKKRKGLYEGKDEDDLTRGQKKVLARRKSIAGSTKIIKKDALAIQKKMRVKDQAMSEAMAEFMELDEKKKKEEKKDSGQALKDAA